MSLFSDFDVNRPSDTLIPIPPHIQRGGPVKIFMTLVHQTMMRLIALNEAGRIDEVRTVNRRRVRHEIDIDIQDPVLVEEILKLFRSNFTQRDNYSMSVVALKGGLDYAQGKCPKIGVGEDPLDFIAIPLGNHAELVLGHILEIIEQEGESVDVSNVLRLLKRLAPHIWRSTIRQVLENAKPNLRLIDSGIRVVAPGTDTPITRETEIEAVEGHIHAARRRIGDAVADLEKELGQLRMAKGDR